MILKDCKEFTSKWKKNIKERVAAMEKAPSLAIVQIGSVEASNRYIRNKIKDCQEVGISAHHYGFDESITQDQLILEVLDLQMHYDSIIIQLPIPAHIDIKHVIEFIRPEWDVDGFRSDSPHTPCTPGGIMKYLDYCDFDLAGKNVTIIGRSDIVGKPLAKLMTDADATVTLCHSKTRNLYQHIFTADLLVTAIGKAKKINCYPIHVPVIDVGINFDENGKLCGDCNNTENRDVTPVPGGVGLMTRCMLLENVCNAAEMVKEIYDNSKFRRS